jgi:signal transduction histidine kinase
VGDPVRVEQVIWALFDNAIKYSPDGSPITVHVWGRENGDGLRSELEVVDTGAGMDSETLRRAFDQFYRSEQARRLAPDGSGVGLYAANGMIRAMGGEISITSRLGAGTSVAVALPAEAVESNESEEG